MLSATVKDALVNVPTEHADRGSTVMIDRPWGAREATVVPTPWFKRQTKITLDSIISL
jgi:hypothetical protein